MKHGYIDKMQVSSSRPYIVYGPVRGVVSEHRLLKPAAKRMWRDWNGCRKQGGYSDAEVYHWRAGRWIRVTADEIEAEVGA